MNNNNLKKVSVIAFLALFTFGINSIALAAPTTPSLGAANSFSILSGTFTRNVGITVIAGDLGYTTLSGGATHTVSGITHVADSVYNTAGIDQGLALSNLNAQACTYTFPPGTVDLATDTTHGAIGIYTPGVYCNTPTSAASIGTSGITLDGAGTYIFKINGAFTTVNNSTVKIINGASSCDVFWAPTEATTLGSNTTFVGTVIDAPGITVGNNTTWNGRALAFGGTVTMDTDNISSSCIVSSLIPVVSSGGTISGGSLPMLTPVIQVIQTPTPVVVNAATPSFPKTGFPSEINNASWFSNVISFIGNLFK